MARLANRNVSDERLLMDGPLVETDAYFEGGWKNVVLGTTGAGPAAVFALNMSDTTDAGLGTKTLMWEHDKGTLKELGHVLSAPEVGVLRDGTWVAVFGNGYESASRRARLFVVDLKTGRLLRDMDTGVGSKESPNGLGGVKLLRDGNGVITAAYAGDLQGNLWKFDLASHRSRSGRCRSVASRCSSQRMAGRSRRHRPRSRIRGRGDGAGRHGQAVRGGR